MQRSYFRCGVALHSLYRSHVLLLPLLLLLCLLLLRFLLRLLLAGKGGR
jgi:hypothetical protein